MFLECTASGLEAKSAQIMMALSNLSFSNLEPKIVNSFSLHGTMMHAVMMSVTITSSKLRDASIRVLHMVSHVTTLAYVKVAGILVIFPLQLGVFHLVAFDKQETVLNTPTIPQSIECNLDILHQSLARASSTDLGSGRPNL